MECFFIPMTNETARLVLAWRYEPPYDFYNADPRSIEDDLQSMTNPRQPYFSVHDSRSELVGFRCFGLEAQVPGGDYDSGALDTGGGLRPDLTGRGLGLSVLQSGLAFGRQLFNPPAFRVTVAAFNARAQVVCQRSGFQPVASFERPSDGLGFIVMRRLEGRADLGWA